MKKIVDKLGVDQTAFDELRPDHYKIIEIQVLKTNLKGTCTDLNLCKKVQGQVCTIDDIKYMYNY